MHEHDMDAVVREKMAQEQSQDPEFNMPYSTYAGLFEDHFARHYIGSNVQYASLEPSYRFGYNMAVDTDQVEVQEQLWDDLEPAVRERWEQDRTDDGSTWEDVKAAVRHGWETAADTLRRSASINITNDAYQSNHNDFHRHYEEHFGIDNAYTYYEDAYRFGSWLGQDMRYKNAEWDEVEENVKRRWQYDHEGGNAWDDVKDAVRYAWEKTKTKSN